MTKEINEVTGILRLFTSPNRGMKPADGIIRAVTIITSEKYGNLSKKTNRYIEKKSPNILGHETTTIKTNPDHILLWTDSKFDYYKVRIAPGTKMNLIGATRLTCNAAGMKAVCSGSPSCYRQDTAGICVHTPLEDEHCCRPMLVDCLLKVKELK